MWNLLKLLLIVSVCVCCSMTAFRIGLEQGRNNTRSVRIVPVQKQTFQTTKVIP